MTLPTLIILVPALTTLILFLLPQRSVKAIRWLSVAGAASTVVLAVAIMASYDRDAGGWQMGQVVSWVEGMGISWNTGVDGISIAMLLLTSCVIFAGTLVSFRIEDRVKEFYILLMALVTGVFGVFASRDLFFFYFSYELAVVPMYLLIGVWGSTNKEYATMKLTLYLTAGAVVALVGLLLLYSQTQGFYEQNPEKLAEFAKTHTEHAVATPLSEAGLLETYPVQPPRAEGEAEADWDEREQEWQEKIGSLSRETPEFAKARPESFNLLQIIFAAKNGAFGESFQLWVFALLLIGFGAIAPMWPLHTWSPGGHAAAPSAASMLHAGVLMKLGSYGIIRIGLPCLATGAVQILPWVAALSMMNIIYGGFVAMAQKDMKFVIGYSSSSHMGYVLLGMASMNVMGLNGAVFLMFAHGVMTALAFGLIGWFYDQTHTRMLPDLGGLAKQIPFIGVCFTIMAFASSGLPGFANFASELMVLFGAWERAMNEPIFFLYAILAVWGIVITATYLLRAVRWAFFGPLNPTWEGRVEDAKGVVFRAPFVFLIVVLVVFGCYPKLLVDYIDVGVQELFVTMDTVRAALGK